MSRRRSALLVLLLAAGIVAACRHTRVQVFNETVAGERPPAGARPLRYGGGLPLRSWNPNGAAGWCEATALLHARLFAIDGAGRVVPDLVESEEIEEEGASRRLRLRKGLTFHDGSPVIAADVVATIEAARRDPRSEVGRLLQPLSRVDARADDEIVLAAASPMPELDAILAELAILPAALLEAGATALEATPVGAGPYRIVAVEEGVAFFTAHEGHHRGPARSPWLTLVTIEDDRARAQALADGVIDLACVKPEMLSLFRDTSRFRIHRAATGVIRAMPLDVAAPGLGDARVRRALAALVDRPRLVAEALGQAGRPCHQLLAPENPAFDDSLESEEWTAAAGRALLDEAGFVTGEDGIRRAEGRPLRIRIVAWQGESFRRQAAAIIAEGWREAGIVVEVLPVDHAGYVAATEDLAGRAETFIGGWSALTAPATVLAKKVMTGGPQNRGRFSDPEIDRLLTEALRTEALGARVAVVRDVLRELDRAMPWIPLVTADVFFAMRADLDGFAFDVIDSWYEAPRLLHAVGFAAPPPR